MRISPAFIKILMLTAGLLSSNSFAYDVDTHFYGTYLMARFAGIGRESAEKIATGAQWMDESYLSDPTSMILMPVTGVAKRRLLHFPSNRVLGILAGSIRDESYGITEPEGIMKYITLAVIHAVNFDGDLRALAVNEKTIPNHEFANAMLSQGLKEGNLMKAATGLHTLEDSYAHAGTRPIEGHSQEWHWPDRPFHDVPKYKMMTASVFRALVAIRAQLPARALDCGFTQFGSRATCRMDAEELQAAYLQVPQVWQTVGYNVLKDSQYVRFALRDAIRRADKLGYINTKKLDGITAPNVEAVLEQSVNTKMLAGRADAYAVMVVFINKLMALEKSTGNEIINYKFINKDMGLATDPTIRYDEYIAAQKHSLPTKFKGMTDPTGGRMAFEYMLATRIMSGFVPVKLDSFNKTEKEDDHAVTREYEMILRIKNMQALIKNVVGDEVVFVESSTATDDGFAYEVLRDPRAETKFERTNPNARYVTFTPEEKRRFDIMIFTYLFPSLTEGDLVGLVKALRRAKIESDKTWKQKVKDFALGGPLTLARTYTAIAGRCALAILPMVRPFLKDLFNAHLSPAGDEKQYQDPDSFAQYKSRNKDQFAQFFGLGDTWVQNTETAELKLNTYVKKEEPKPWAPVPASDIIPVSY